MTHSIKEIGGMVPTPKCGILIGFAPRSSDPIDPARIPLPVQLNAIIPAVFLSISAPTSIGVTPFPPKWFLQSD
uniref:Uncharacterized protein n=1 Tax=Picea glauca TaxID=3330 RepID=A0A101LZD7_PICGL|nr:hypothetical protein ABT39_MTgene5125 [Picea glauca]